MTTALYLAHMNPVTNAHVEIIKELQDKAETVKVMPVIFKSGTNEINSKSFPFSFETRKKMLESVFADSIKITDDYAFFAPFKRYMPPLISPKSWKLRRQILSGVDGDFFSYTGDKAEGYMLRIYRLSPRVGKRKQISATSVKEKMYGAAAGSDADWNTDVPKSIAKIIKDEWSTVEKFARQKDATRKVIGMKFPSEGWA